MPNPFTNILQWLQLASMVISWLFFHLCCLDSFAAADFANVLNTAQHNFGDLMNSSLGAVVRQSSRSQSSSSNKDPTIKISKLAKIDLNELPEDLDLEVGISQDKLISGLGSEMKFIHDFKRQRLMPSGKNLSPENFQSFSSEVNNFSSDFNLNQVIIRPKTSYDRSLATRQSRNFNRETFLILTPESPVPKIYTTGKTVEPNNRNHKSEKLKNQNPLSMTEKNANLSDEIKLAPTDLGKMIDVDKTSHYMKVIKQQFFSKSVIFGPFDLVSDKTYRSPYNRFLLQFIEQNISDIVPESLGSYKIDENFLVTVKTLLCKDNEEMLYIKEDFVLEAVNDLSSKYQDSIINNWIKFSSSRRIVPSDPTSARTKFNFRIVFPKFLTYENFAGVFFTEDMRSRIIGEFKDLERRFVMKKEEHKIYKKHVKRFMDSIWAALTGFLAYVHAINAIIVSDSVLPLENYKIVEKQEEAFNFFFDLHKDAENFVRCDSERKTHKLKVEEGWKDLSFEVKRNHVLDIIFNSEARLERKAWLCIELWMIKYRPELYNIATNNSTNGILGKYNKFRSFINRVLFPLFSGILKYQKLQCQNKFGEKIHHAC